MLDILVKYLLVGCFVSIAYNEIMQPIGDSKKFLFFEIAAWPLLLIAILAASIISIIQRLIRML